MKIRQAIQDDSEDIWHWRNDAITRNMSFQTEEISKDENLDWFTSSLASKDRLLLIEFARPFYKGGGKSWKTLESLE